MLSMGNQYLEVDIHKLIFAQRSSENRYLLIDLPKSIFATRSSLLELRHSIVGNQCWGSDHFLCLVLRKCSSRLSASRVLRVEEKECCIPANPRLLSEEEVKRAQHAISTLASLPLKSLAST